MQTVTFESPLFEGIGGFSDKAVTFTEEEEGKIYEIFSRNCYSDISRDKHLFPRLTDMISRNKFCAHMHTSVGVLMDIQTVFDVYVKKQFAPKTYIYPCENTLENFFEKDCNIFRAVDYVVFFDSKSKLIDSIDRHLKENRILIEQMNNFFDNNF